MKMIRAVAYIMLLLVGGCVGHADIDGPFAGAGVRARVGPPTEPQYTARGRQIVPGPSGYMVEGSDEVVVTLDRQPSGEVMTPLLAQEMQERLLGTDPNGRTPTLVRTKRADQPPVQGALPLRQAYVPGAGAVTRWEVPGGKPPDGLFSKQ